MIPTPGIRNMIREAKTHQIYTAMQTGHKYGMQTMDESLADLYRAGKISYEVAISRAVDPNDLRQRLGKAVPV
jgi:twitching motility protein PilT